MFGKKSESATKGQWDSYYKALLKPDFPKAISILNSLREREAENPQLFIKLGDCQQRTANTPLAIESYHKAASLYVEGGFMQKAVAIYKIILRLEPKNKEAIKKTQDIIQRIERERGRPMEFGGPAAIQPESEEPLMAPESDVIATPAEETTQEAPQSWPEAGETPSADESQAASWPEPEEVAAPEEDESPAPREGWPETQPALSEEVPQGEEQWPSLDISEIPAPEAETTEVEMPEADIPEILTGLNREIALYILENTGTISFKSGEAVIREGDTGDSLYIVRKGRAEVVLQLLGRTLKLATLSPGDVFGEVAFLTGRPRTASVIAVGELTVLELSGDVLRAAIEHDSVIMQKLMGFYQSRVQDTINKVKKK